MVCEIRFRWAFCHIHRCLSFFGFYTSESDLSLVPRTYAHLLVAVSFASLSYKKVEKSFSQYFDISIAYCMSDYKPAQIGYLFHLWISFYFHWKTTTSTVLLRNGVFLKRVFCSYTVLVEICITFFFYELYCFKMYSSTNLHYCQWESFWSVLLCAIGQFWHLFCTCLCLVTPLKCHNLYPPCTLSLWL